MTASRHQASVELQSLLDQSSHLRAAGKLPESLVPLRQAARRAPQNAPIQHDLGVTFLAIGDTEAALRHFDRAVTLRPSFGAAHFRRGIALDLAGRPGAAQAYAEAIEAGVKEPELFSRLAALLHQQGRRDEALPLYRQAAALAPGTTQALLDAARAALLENDLNGAEPLLRQFLAQQPRHAGARGQLAFILRARGEFAASAAEVEQALADNPGEIGLFYDLVQTGRVSPAQSSLVARMRAALARPASTPQRLKLRLALARALDDLGDYQAAAAELDQADLLRREHNPFDPAASARQAEAIASLFTQAYMAHPAHQGRDSDLPILVVGMPRSGTTLVEQILASHPSVAGAGEVNFWEAQGRFFLSAADPEWGADLRAVADAYLERLRSVAPAALRVVDKMPFNFRWAALVHIALPNARIIHCRRNPADTCLSILSTNLPATPSFSAAREDLAFLYRQYLGLMAHLRSVLPPARLLEIDYEAVVSAPEPTIRALLKSCGLDWNDACLAPERTQREVLTFSQFQARQPIYRHAAGRSRAYADWIRKNVLF